MDEIEIFEHTKDDYIPAVYSGSWLVAFLNHAKRFDQNHMNEIERHMLTDEVFVLLSGKAVLIIGENLKQYVMEPNKVYNVKKGVWHAICVSKDARVLIVENADTSAENSEYKPAEISVKLD